MARFLIVNADDCNLTRGVTRAILECHATGIVTSTTFLVNLPIQDEDRNQLKKAKRLGVGLHLNITLGAPLSKPSRISSLIGPDGNFQKLGVLASKRARIKPAHIFIEYENQIREFKKVVGRLPTHLDTHHHLHATKTFLAVLECVAKRYKLRFRSPVVGETVRSKKNEIPLFGDLDPKKPWNRKRLETCIQNLPEGVSEIMCHPGSNDAGLKKISSFQKGRTTEWRIFRCNGLKALVKREGIKLLHYGML